MTIPTKVFEAIVATVVDVLRQGFEAGDMKIIEYLKTETRTWKIPGSVLTSATAEGRRLYEKEVDTLFREEVWQDTKVAIQLLLCKNEKLNRETVKNQEFKCHGRSVPKRIVLEVYDELYSTWPERSWEYVLKRIKGYCPNGAWPIRSVVLAGEFVYEGRELSRGKVYAACCRVTDDRNPKTSSTLNCPKVKRAQQPKGAKIIKRPDNFYLSRAAA